jgi:hypothetical protein
MTAECRVRAPVTSLAPNGVGKLGYGQHEVEGLIGWAVLVAQATKPLEPNKVAWQHLPHLDDLRQQLGAVLSG